MNGTATLNQAISDEQRKFLSKVYLQMFTALVVTAAAAYFTASSETMIRLIYGSYLAYVFVVAELVLVITLSAAINKLSPSVALILFYVYALVNGVTLSSIFLLYSVRSITRVFIASALMFLAMSAYGMFTKTDLGKYVRFFGMALIGIIVVSVINMILGSSLIDWGISILGVGLFAGLTAYHTQHLLRVSADANGSDFYKKHAIYGSLRLYLDFINIFVKLLRLFGRRK
ncbi:MAG: Bax inhibitor-1/YccA family protein [Spirochaetaceae bacterium]|nr:Bax inhibitor-1/YccA family protein [Spirochaetaceae bacterium]